MAVGILILIGLAVVYVLPTIVAVWRRHPSAGSVAAINALLGWTLLGWVAALAWALTYIPPSRNALIVRRGSGRPSPLPSPSAPERSPDERVYPSFVAGLAYPDPASGTIRADYALGLVREDDELIPRREPDNPHDPKAVLLLHQGFGLGYVPRRHDWIADAIDDGKRIRIFVTKVIQDDSSNLLVTTEVVVRS